MPKASEVAAELRKFADRLDTNPDAELRNPVMGFHHYCENEKSKFLNLCKLLPRPLKKSLEDSYTPMVELNYTSDAITIYSRIPQVFACTLVEPARPAVYKCDPILSAEEEAELV